MRLFQYVLISVKLIVSKLYSFAILLSRPSCESFRMEKSFKTAFKKIKALMAAMSKSNLRAYCDVRRLSARVTITCRRQSN